MSIALCCVSMPALSKMLAYHVPLYEKLKIWTSSRFASTRSTIANRYHKQPVLLRKFFKASSSETSRGDDSYINLENNAETRLQSVAAYELRPKGNSVQTIIGTGNKVPIEENGIHLNVKLQQNSRHCDML